MAKIASISARIDPELKRNAEAIFNELELTASQAIALFYRQVINKQGIPFEITVGHRQNGTNGSAPSDVAEQSANGLDKSVTEAESEAPDFLGPEHDAILQEREAYEAMHPELRKLYPDQYVAVYQGEVVDHDTDKTALLQRRYDNYSGKSVLITQVEESAEQKTLNFRSPRLIR